MKADCDEWGGKIDESHSRLYLYRTVKVVILNCPASQGKCIYGC